MANWKWICVCFDFVLGRLIYPMRDCGRCEANLSRSGELSVWISAMPCLFYNSWYTMAQMNMTIASDIFVTENDPKKTLVLDCRAANLYATSHIRGSYNIALPTLLLRRLSTDKITVESVFKCPIAKEWPGWIPHRGWLPQFYKINGILSSVFDFNQPILPLWVALHLFYMLEVEFLWENLDFWLFIKN